MKKGFLIGIVLLVIILIGYLFFSQGTLKKSNEINIGVILPLSGPASEIGKNILDGINIAKKIDDEQNIIKYKIVVEDSKIEPKQGISAASKLIDIDKVKAIIGVAASPIALAVAPICEKNKIIMLSSTASTPLLTSAGDYIFRIYPSDLYDGKILANFAFTKKKIKTFSILYLNNDFGQGLKNVFVNKYIALGGKINTSESFLPADTDFRTKLLKIKQSNSSGLLIIAIDMQYINIIKQIRELNIDTDIFAPVTFDNTDILKTLGNAANGIIYSRPFYDLSKRTSKINRFIDEYKKLKGKEPSLLTALGYDSYDIIVNALRENGNNTDKAKEYLYSLDDNGVSGNIKFDKNGDVIKKLEIMIIKNNKAIQYEEN